MNIKRNIIFSLESRKKDGVPIVENVPIRMRVIFASQRIEFTTGYRIDAAKWDTDKQRVKPGCTNKLKQSASEINTDLLRYYTEIQNIFKEFEVQGTMPTTAQVKEAFNSLHSEKREEEQQKPLTFAPMEVFGEFIKECGTQNGWSDATYEKFAAVRKHLEKFDKELTFETLDEPKLTSYVNFLKDVEGLRNTSTMKQIAYLKWFLRWCTKKGYCMNNAYEMVIGVTILLAVMGLQNNIISRAEGVILLACMVVYMLYLLRLAKRGVVENEEMDAYANQVSFGRLILLVVVGVAAIIFGSHVAVEAASAIARIFGISERFIGLTIVAFGTSLPELVTSVAAARRGNSDIAVGNIVGSNLFNIMFVVGITAVIVPVVYQPTFRVDSIVAVAAAVLLLVCVYRGRVLKRRHGLLMLACYGGYFAYLLLV